MLKGTSSGYSWLMLSKNKGAGGKHKSVCLGMKQAGCAKPQLLEIHGLVSGQITLLQCLPLTHTRYLPEHC